MFPVEQKKPKTKTRETGSMSHINHNQPEFQVIFSLQKFLTHGQYMLIGIFFCS